MNIGTYRLERTCTACPEQYDVFIDEERVGYLRLRNGIFYAKCMRDNEMVYKIHAKGDGVFEEEERPIHLYNALARLQLHLIKLEFSQKDKLLDSAQES